MENHRDRSEGWQHAKLTGHENEAILEKLMVNDADTQKHFLTQIGKPNNKIINVRIGGLNETDVECIFPHEKTKSKTDMYVSLDDGSNYNISIKKSLSGQVYLIGIDRFINGFELQYKKSIPSNVKKGIELFWGKDPNVLAIAIELGVSKDYEIRKHRLVADTLKKYNREIYRDLLNWFRENINDIFDFCFSRGLAKNESDWASVVWYINEFGENNVDKIFYLPNVSEKLKSVDRCSITYGNRGGGTTIQLPFGFVQWHSPSKIIPGDMQFHHNFRLINDLMEEY